MAVFELGVLQVVGWFLATSMLAAATWVTFGGQHRNPQHDRELAWFLWHWFTGGPLEPIRSYPTAGTRPRRAGRRACLAAVRTAAAVGFVAAVYVTSGAPGGSGLATVAAWAGGGAAVMATAAPLIAWVAVEWSMWRHYIQPLHWAVADDAGWDLDMRWWRVRRYITIRRGVNGVEVFVECGPRFKARDDARKKVVETVIPKLGLKQVVPNWTVEGLHRYVEFVRQEPVPAKVSFRDPKIRELIEAESTSWRVLRGLTRGGDPIWLDLKKAPHVLVSAGTGGGKSVALGGAVAQLMYHGAEVVVLDIKRISHLWLRDLPKVRYARDIGEIHRALLDVYAEVQRRTRLWDPLSALEVWAGKVPQFPRLVVLFDEISSTMGLLKDHWSDIREPGDPPTSPAIQAYKHILNQGRQVDTNILAAGQRGSANAVGSGDARENFEQIELVDRFSLRTWKMFSDQPYVSGISHPGRAQILIGAAVIETQILHIPEKDAYWWITDKKGNQPCVHQPADVVSPGETGVDTSTSGRDELPGGVPAVSLWAASKDKGRGVVTLKFGALTKAAQRDRKKGEFPEPVNDKGEYDPRDLQRWEKNRVRPLVIDGVDDIGGNEGDEVDRVNGMTNESLAEDDSRGAWLQPKGSTVDSDRERFWASVDPPNEHGCELWAGAVNGDGYGYFKVAGRAVAVHRFAYEDHTALIPEGYTIDHRIGHDGPCTSKRCVAKGHLQVVTNERNVELRHERDRAAKGAPA